MVGQVMSDWNLNFEKGGIFMEIKKILGGIGAIGMALGGLVLAGKNEFGKKLGTKPSEPDLEDEFDDENVDEIEKTIVDTLDKVLDNEEEETE